MMKKEKKEAANAAKATADAQAEKPKMSKKEEMLMKALEMEELDMQRSQDAGESDQPKLSKKELKALKKKEENANIHYRNENKILSPVSVLLARLPSLI